MKRAANSDIAFWLAHNKTPRKIVQRGRFPNIVMTLTPHEDLAAAHTKFITKMAKAKCMTLQDGQRDDRLPDQAEQNEELPD